MKNFLQNILQTLAAVVCMAMAATAVQAHDKADMIPGYTVKAGGNDTGSVHDGLLAQQDTLRVLAQVDTAGMHKRRDWKTWRPNAKRAMWLAIVLPGAGQIYNRKYWKVPIVYGGFVGCAYAMRWNNQMFRDYSQAYMDIMDDDPNTQSYNQFLHLGAKIDESNLARYQTLFKKRKDKYRRWRDMSFFCLVGVYALSIIDAYVDASLSEFDISKDLSLRVEPTIINNERERNPLRSNSLGMSFSLNF